MQRIVWMLSITIVLFVLGLPPQAQGMELSADIKPVQREYDPSEGILVQFTLMNGADEPLSILKWGTPFDGFKSDMFIITFQGARIVYTGILVKRGAPQKEDYLTIGPRSQISTIVDLSKGYAMYGVGEYQVQFDAQVSYLRSVDARRDPVARVGQARYYPVQLTTSPVRFSQRGERQKPSPIVRRAFSNCTTNEQQEVNTSFQSSQTMAADALTALQYAASPTQAARYITWFGPHDTTRYTTVQNHFSSLSTALNIQTFDWDCHGASCGSGYFAYVYPNQPYKIYLCGSFWGAGNSGTDSRPGVIVHETSHFTVVASTADYFYSHDNCLYSAQTSPALAINNADSHEYFAEDIPTLPMGPVTNPVNVNFAHSSTEIGTEALPYNTVSEGVAAVAAGGVLQIEAGTSHETLQINKAMTITAIGGTVTIGQP